MESLDQMLQSVDPVRVFNHLKRRPVEGTADKVKMLKDLVKVWEFFAMEKRAGRMYYRPSHPGDTKGITRKIEAYGTKKAYSIQFNAKRLEHTFSVDFKEGEIALEQVVGYLNRTMKYNKLVHVKGKSKGMEM